MASLLASIRVLFAKNWRVKQRESWLNKRRPTTPSAWLFPPMVTDIILPLVIILYLVRFFCGINEQRGGGVMPGAKEDLHAVGIRRHLMTTGLTWPLPRASTTSTTTSSVVTLMTALPLLLTKANMTLVTLDRPENHALLAYLDRVYAGDTSLGLPLISSMTKVLPLPQDVSISAVDAYLEAYPKTSGVRVYAALDLRRATPVSTFQARVFLNEDAANSQGAAQATADQIGKYFSVSVQEAVVPRDQEPRLFQFPGALALEMELNMFLRSDDAGAEAGKVPAAISPMKACRLVDTMLYDVGLSWQDLPSATSPLGGGEASCEHAIKQGRVPPPTLAFLSRFVTQAASVDELRNLVVTWLPKRPQKTISGPLEGNIVFYMAYLFLWPYSRLIRDIVVEKEKQLKEYLLIMGLQPMALLVSWFALYLVASVGVVALAVVMLSGSMFTATQASEIHFFVVLMVFATSMLLFGLAITPIFNTARTSSTAAPLLYVVLGIAPFLKSWIGDEAVEESLLKYVIWAMEQVSSPVVFMDALRQIVALDALTGKIRPIAWQTVADPSVKMVFQSVGYLVLGWYLENVFPRTFGVQKRWYFVLMPSYWRPQWWLKSSRPSSDDDEELVQLTTTQEAKEDDGTIRELSMSEYLHHFRPILLVKNLSKRYPNGKLAVQNVSFGVKKGEIFGLLGPNGAGKSTTMAVLCGMLKPTSGDAFVGHKSVLQDPHEIRKSLSVCFQQNILFDDLTVWEHLTLVYDLKTSMGIKAIDKELWGHKLRHFGLEEKQNALAKTLSGGQKRKLSLVLALMDTSRVVLLDEPTAGMDLKARVDTWDALKKAVSHRAVILTTHSMQEAQVLCENIGIVADGKLKCCGSSLFLREQFGVGYKLTVVHGEQQLQGVNKTKAQLVLEMVQKVVPSAVLVSDNKWETRLQLNNDEPNKMIPIFQQLEKWKLENRISRYAVAATDLEDVFVQVTNGGDVYNHAMDDADASLSTTTDPASKKTKKQHKADSQPGLGATSSSVSSPQQSDTAAMPLQLHALLVKKWKLMVRNKRSFFGQYVWPILFFAVLLALGSNLSADGSNGLETITSLPLTASHSSLFVGSLAGVPSNVAKQMIAQMDLNIQTNRITWKQVDSADQVLDTILHTNTSTPYFGAVLIQNATTLSLSSSPFLQFSIYYNQSIARSLPVTLEWISTAYCKSIHSSSSSDNCELAVTKSSFPRPLIVTSKLGGDGGTSMEMDDSASNDSSKKFMLAFYILITLSSITSNYITAVVKEQEAGLKRLQFLHLASRHASRVYWLSHLVFDYIGYCAALCVLFVVTAVYQMLWTSDLMAALVVHSLVFGLSMLAFSYLLSLAFTSHSSAQSVMSYVASFQVLGSSVVFALSYVPSLCTKVNTVAFFMRVLPLFAYGEAILNFVTMELTPLRTQCVAVLPTTSSHSSKNKNLLETISMDGFGGFELPSPSPWDWDVGGRSLAYLVGSFFMYMALLLAVDTMQMYPTIFQIRLGWLLRRRRSPSGQNLHQQPRDIENASATDIIAVDHLTKVYNPKKSKPSSTTTTRGDQDEHQEEEERPVVNQSGQVVAVNNISFSVQRNDCVALLGVNGSGKSTTFEILTSGIAPTSGKACIDGVDVTLSPQQASRLYGYCPQTNIQFSELSVKEHLELFYRLRTRQQHHDSLSSSQEQFGLNKLMTQLDLHQVSSTQAGNLSGGNKRRLMLALALLSDDVDLLLLDEPSAGVDVVARRLMWKVLHDKRQQGNGNGTRELSCLFTTHSMEEAEAVCANAVVLNKGTVVWNGSIPELKHHAARGISISLRLDTSVTWGQDQVRYYVDKLRAGSGLVEVHEGNLDMIPVESLETAWRVCRSHHPRTKYQQNDMALISETDTQWITALITRVQQEPRATSSNSGEVHSVAMETTAFVKEWLLREAFATIESQLFEQLISARSHEPVKPVALQNAMGSGTSTTAVYETTCNDRFALLDAFTTMETHKAAFGIARYSISELSLERVFEQFT